eukprot:GHRR01021341.1.p1 GENE.GHRR01021341.1~~GHRR01021341.1.p1  ORF type:complete len:159 (+),score=44.53 GHRR01021341.1:572-1048(+)
MGFTGSKYGSLNTQGIRFSAQQQPALTHSKLLLRPCNPPGPRLRWSRSNRRSIVPTAVAGGGAGSFGGNSNDGWSGGGGGGDGGAGDSSRNQPKDGGVYWQGWADRVAADPEFPFKVLLEQIIGVGASVIGDMSSRPNWGLNELDFVFATLVVSLPPT